MTTSLKTYCVDFWVEHGYCVLVEARSRDHAEELVQEQLDEFGADEIPTARSSMAIRASASCKK